MRCAQALQAQFRTHNADKTKDEQIHVRIGIHLGDLIERDGDVFGDGANIAARLQELAEPDTICISQKVYEEVTAEGIRQQMDLLLASVLLATKAVPPHMKRQRGGSIINNASIGGVADGYTPLLYSMVKAAVIHATRWVALELAEYSSRVNATSPIGIVTSVFAMIFGIEGERALEANATVRTWPAKSNPMKRAGEVDDIAGVALFLASDDSALMNG